jgi:hypothetical protein
MLEKGGWMLCFFHHDRRRWSELDAEVMALAERPLSLVWHGTSGPDFPESDERRVLRLSAFRADA